MVHRIVVAVARAKLEMWMGFSITSKAATSVAVATFTTLLSACGGNSSPAGVAIGASTQSVAMTVVLPPETPNTAIEALPTYHVAPVLLDPPADTDATAPNTSAVAAAHTQMVPFVLSHLSTRRLTLRAMTEATGGGVAPQQTRPNEITTPMAAGTQVQTYSPAQIRAAYQLPILPATNVTPSVTQAAQMGAGQTLYIIDSNSDPNIVTELAAFNQKFGLPGCTTTAIPPTTKLPLPAALATGCTFSVVYNTSSAAMTSTVPAYDSGWQTEIALDVQWAHATAPMARIILIEAPDAMQNSLLGAIALANAMGPGVVSMSFGAPEGSWTTSVDSNFTAPNMTYVAATGDSGAGVEWPAVSPHVLGVGGTSLSYIPGIARSEIAWTNGGGGVSQYTPTPSYQAASVPGMGTLGHRAVSDVSFNADPATGQYVVIINPGSTSPGWLSAGGTSLAAPQWAGLIAVANAERALATKQIVGQPHALLYGLTVGTPAAYATAFSDITVGTNGGCKTCIAKIGYDTPTGLGTPNGVSLLGSLSGANTSGNVAPVIASAPVSGTVGVPLSFTVNVTATHSVTFMLGGAPPGMTISTAGIVTWPSPVSGSYSVTVTAQDTQTGLFGSSVYPVTIGSPQPPVVKGIAVDGTVGATLSFTISVNATHPVYYALSAAPSGMTVSSGGIVSWPSPVAGVYHVTVKVTDTTTGLSGSGAYTITITAPLPPIVSSGSVTGTAGLPLSFSVSVSAPNPVTFALSGAPSGMTVASSGVVSWLNPLAGKFAATIVATDTKTQLIGKSVYTITITQAGPVIQAAPMNGIAGKPMGGTITITDATSNSLAIGISGVPIGMTFSNSGSVIAASWSKPVVGSYTMALRVQDGNGKTASASVLVTVTAH